MPLPFAGNGVSGTGNIKRVSGMLLAGRVLTPCVSVPHTRAMEDYTYDENYGDVRSDTHRLLKRHNVSPADYLMLEIHFRNDWDRINRFILDNVKGIRRNFYYPFGG